MAQSGKKGSKNARSAQELLDLIEAINARTETRRGLAAAQAISERNRGMQKERPSVGETDKQRDRQRGGTFLLDLPPPPGRGEPPTKPTGIRTIPIPAEEDPPWEEPEDESDEVVPTDDPTKPAPSPKSRRPELQDCEELKETLLALGLPPIVCGGASGGVSIRGGSNP